MFQLQLLDYLQSFAIDFERVSIIDSVVTLHHFQANKFIGRSTLVSENHTSKRSTRDPIGVTKLDQSLLQDKIYFSLVYIRSPMKQNLN